MYSCSLRKKDGGFIHAISSLCGLAFAGDGAFVRSRVLARGHFHRRGLCAAGLAGL
jgi:hypothetical protein